jgi:nuclease S1
MGRRIAALLALSIVPAFGWGPEGHSLVARIAWAQLTPAARERVTSILAPGQTLSSVASWADEIRRSRSETGPWHYIDIPIDKPHLDMARDCPKNDCVIVKIADFRKTLQDPSASAEQRREALMFVVHFIGDMHQPLHCSDNHDKGGNDVRVQFFDRRTNLHSLWDGVLIDRLGTEDQLLPELSLEAARHKKWRKGSVEKWAEESHKAAVKIVYGKLSVPGSDGLVTLKADYEQFADPLIKTQLEKAGLRLARVLNTTLL